MCSLCIEGYNRDTTTCEICDNGAVPLRIGLLLFVVALLFALVAVCRRKIQKQWQKYQPLWRDVLRVASINITFLQINSSLPSVIEVEWPSEWTKFVRNFNFVNIDVLSLVGMNCIGDFNYYLSFCIMICLPVGILLMAGCNYKASMSIMKRRLLNMTPEQKQSKEKEALHLLFELADSDHSDHIDPSELMGILRQLGWKMNVKTARSLCEKIGAVTDEHGHLTLTEAVFLTAMISGKISKELDGAAGVMARSKSYANKSHTQSTVSSGGDDASNGSAAGTTASMTSSSSRKRSKATTSLDALTDSDDLVKWTLRRNIVSNSLSGAIQLLLLAHTPVSRKVFQYFHCNDIAGRELLIADYDINCLSPEYFAFMPIVVVVLITYTCALPMTILFYLFRHRNELYSTSVYQRIGWLYNPYVRGAEFWQVFDVLMKMVLTGILIYIPTTSRAGIASLICVVAVASLNYFEPHKNKVLFWLSQISFLTTGSKYIMALLLSSSFGMKEKEMRTIGMLLIGLDLGFMVASMFSIVIAVWMIHAKFQTIQRKNRKNKQSSKKKVLPTSLTEQEKDGHMLRNWSTDFKENNGVSISGGGDDNDNTHVKY